MASGSVVLVTGGAGFIGSHIAEDLVRRGEHVRIYDNFSSGSEENLISVRGDVEVIRGDVLDEESLDRSMRGVDVVSHQAAQLEITRCVEDPVWDLKCNTMGTLNVLRSAIRNGVTKVINASSACVYGQSVSMPQSEHDHPTNPNWAYGVSKLAAEKYCQIFSAAYSMPIISLRYSIVYGPREWYGRVLTVFLKRVLERKPPVVFGCGSQLRDFVYIDDLVRAHRCAMEVDFSGAHSVNVSTGKGTSVLELAHKVVPLVDVPLQPLREDVAVGGWSSIMDRQRLPAELQRMVLDNALAKTLLGWEPMVTLDEGLKMEFLWLQANPHRWKGALLRI